jgi:dipeptidyl aminopeptidase/acylaminoacyl peptidase
VRPSDIAHLVTPSDPRWHPDGRHLAFVVTRVDVDEDRYDRRIHRTDGEVTHQLTAGPEDGSPRWSPDGRQLAFLRKGREDGAVPQLALLPTDGGEARVVTELSRGVSDLAWSPDGRSLVLVASTWNDDLADLSDDERRRRPRRISRLPYRGDGNGWTHERRQQLWLVELGDDRDGDADVPAVKVRQLTDLPHDVGGAVWSRDGQRIHAITRAQGIDAGEPHEQLVTVDVATGDVQRGPVGAWESVDVDLDGVVHLTGIRDPFGWPGVERVHRVVGAGPDADLVDLTGHLDRAVVPGGPSFAPVGPRFVADGFVTALEDRGTSRLVHVTTTTSPPATRDLVGGARGVTGADVHPDGHTLAVCWTDPTTPGELSIVRVGEETVVTGFGDRFRAAVEVAATTRWSFERDGVELDVWSVAPDGFETAAPRSVPVLINVHGGPTAQYGDVFFDEFQVEAAAGYLVAGTNPRGSSGRGTEWARAVVGAWPDRDPVDLRDLRSLADAVLERFPQADPGRIGIMGGSYGGYATARIIADDHRYASAIVERGLLEWGSFGGTSDIGPFFDRMFLGVDLADDPAPHHAASPVFTAARVTTPTLVLHSEHDWRCPIEQAERYFVALLRAGVSAELLRFPDEGHELSRSGSPKHRMERFAAVLDWHARYLRPNRSPRG